MVRRSAVGRTAASDQERYSVAGWSYRPPRPFVADGRSLAVIVGVTTVADKSVALLEFGFAVYCHYVDWLFASKWIAISGTSPTHCGFCPALIDE
jgi:hypothetical protein